MVYKSLALSVALALCGGHGFAQEAASVAGIVTDATSGVLPGVTVTATEVSSGRQYVAVTDERGEYPLANAQGRTYPLHGGLPGVCTVRTSQLQVVLRQPANVP